MKTDSVVGWVQVPTQVMTHIKIVCFVGKKNIFSKFHPVSVRRRISARGP